MVHFAEFEILQELGNSELVLQPFHLHRNDEMLPLPVRADIQLINFNLSDALDFCSEMILEREGALGFSRRRTSSRMRTVFCLSGQFRTLVPTRSRQRSQPAIR